MKIALFGATGMIGQRILREAVQRGHDVTAIVRDPTKLPESHPQIHPLQGDLLDPLIVAGVVAGHDAVVSAFAPSGSQPVESIVTATRSLIVGLRSAGVKRLIVVSGAGSLEVAPGMQLIDASDFPAAWRPLATSHAVALDELRNEAADLDWTCFSPPALIQPGERTGIFRLGGDKLVVDDQGNSRITAEDYAVALIDELEQPKRIKQRFTVGY